MSYYHPFYSLDQAPLSTEQSKRSAEREMCAFDRLPREVRDVLNDVRTELSASKIAGFLRMGASVEHVCAFIRNTEPKEMDIR